MNNAKNNPLKKPNFLLYIYKDKKKLIILMEKNNLNKLNIFNKNIKNNFKLIPFTTQKNTIKNIRYFPPISKEWKNSIYAFNKSSMMNLSTTNDININSLIKSYFNLRFIPKFIFKKYKPRWVRRPSMNKIYVSNAEIKHTNSKAIITVYNYNREKISLLKKIKKLKASFFKRILFLIANNEKYYGKLLKVKIRSLFFKELILIRKYKFKFNLNKYKFEEKLLYKLSDIIGMYLNKKVEFNIVNMKSIVLNSDIFTKILTHKLWKKKIYTMHRMNFILNKAVLAKENVWNKENTWDINNVDFTLLKNKYNNINLVSILKNNNFNNFLKKVYNNIIFKNNLGKNFVEMYDIIFNSIKYKNMAGIRLEVKGRLSKRYRADRAIYKVKWKGGLKNIYASQLGLSAVKLRGYHNSNVEYSIFTSKRRIGAFAVKGWISGK